MKKFFYAPLILAIVLLASIPVSALASRPVNEVLLTYSVSGSGQAENVPIEKTFRLRILVGGFATLSFIEGEPIEVEIIQGFDLILTREAGDVFSVKGRSSIVFGWNAGPRDARGQPGPYEFRGSVKGAGVFADGFDDEITLNFKTASYFGQLTLEIEVTLVSISQVDVSGEGIMRFGVPLDEIF